MKRLLAVLGLAAVLAACNPGGATPSTGASFEPVPSTPVETAAPSDMSTPAASDMPSDTAAPSDAGTPSTAP